jgi:hypothetical protein
MDIGGSILLVKTLPLFPYFINHKEIIIINNIMYIIIILKSFPKI